MFQLNKLKPTGKKRKRIGRGGSRGGTSGRGHKGQKARSGGKSRVGTSFEGGQMPLVRRLPKRGFSNISFAKDVFIINLQDLEKFFEEGETVTKEVLLQKGLLKNRPHALIKVLGKGSLTKKLTVHVDRISDSARTAIEKHGGEVHV